MYSHHISSNLTYTGVHRAVSGWVSVIAVDGPLFLSAAVGVSTAVYVLLSLRGAGLYFGAIVCVTLCGYSLAALCSIWCGTVEAAATVFTVLEAIGECSCMAIYMRK